MFLFDLTVFDEHGLEEWPSILSLSKCLIIDIDIDILLLGF